MMFRLVNRLLSFLQHIHNHRFYVFSVYTICLFYEIFFFSSHNFFFTTAAWKKTVCGHSFLFDCVYICLCQGIQCDAHFTDFLMTHIVPIFSIYCVFFFSSFDLFSIFRLFCIIFVYVCAFHNSPCIRAFIRSNTIVFIWTGAIHMNVRTLHKWKSHFIATLSFRQSTTIYYNHIFFFINGTSTFRVN